MIILLKKEITSILNNKYSGIMIPDFEIEIPADKNKADYVCNIAFILAKELKGNPLVIAEEFTEALNKQELLKKYVFFSAAKPGFINITVKDEYLSELIKSVINLAENFGHNKLLAGEKWVVEHTSPNPNKAMHIGHLRNNLIGMAIANILEANGAQVICDAVDNDRGIAIIKAMWGYLMGKHREGKKDVDIHYWLNHQEEWLTPEEVNLKADHFVGECYAVGAQEFKTNPEAEKIMREMLLSWEAKDQEVLALWQKILDYAYEGIQQTLKRLGNRWDKIWHEHEHYDLGKELVQEGLKKGIFKVSDEGTVISQLEKYHLPDTVVLRSDGTSLYLTQDIGLTKLKREFYQADKLAWVIGPEQNLAMKQLFAICEQLGIGKVDDYFHIAYGLVAIKDTEGNKKKMSSRAGDTILIDDLIDNLKKELIIQRPIYSDIEAEKISLAAIKFMILKSGRMAGVAFDTEASLRLDGDSGVYILYTYARMHSLLEKGVEIDFGEFKFTEGEKEVLVNLSHFPLVVKNSLRNFSPQVIAEYLINLSQSFNSLYGQEKFINEEDQKETTKKIFLTRACIVVMANAMKLLGIVPVEKI